MDNQQSSFDTRDSSQILVGRIDERLYPTGSGINILKKADVYATSPYGFSSLLSDITGYSGIAAMSFDGLLRPISLSGIGGLPRFARYALASGKGNSIPQMPPFILSTGSGLTASRVYDAYNIEISQRYLNPIVNPTGRGLNFSFRHEASGSGSGLGHDIELLGHPATGSGNASMITSLGNGSGIESYANDYKLLGLRGPLLMTAWGYDTNNKPIPNAADTYNNAIVGIFTENNLQDYFMPDFLQKSNTWPVGPIDLRWDRKRGCWTAPSPYRELKAIAADNIFPLSSGRCFLSTGDPLFTPSGQSVSYGTGINHAEIIAFDTTNSVIEKGERLLVGYDASVGHYYIKENKDNGLFPVVFNTTGFYSQLGNLSGQRLLNIRTSDSAVASTTTGENIAIYNDLRPNKYPIFSGYKGWCQKSSKTVSNVKSLVYDIVDAEKPYQYIYFRVNGDRDISLAYDRYPVEVTYGFNGNAIPTNCPVYVRDLEQDVFNFLWSYGNYQLQSGAVGIGILDESFFNQADRLTYQVVDMPLKVINQTGICGKPSSLSSNQYIGNAIQLGKGLYFESAGNTGTISSYLTLISTGSKSSTGPFVLSLNSGSVINNAISSGNALGSIYIGDGLRIGNATNECGETVTMMNSDIKASGIALGVGLNQFQNFSILKEGTGLRFYNASVAAAPAVGLNLYKDCGPIRLEHLVFNTGFINSAATIGDGTDRLHTDSYWYDTNISITPGASNRYATVGTNVLVGKGLALGADTFVKTISLIDYYKYHTLELDLQVNGFPNSGVHTLEAGAGITFEAGSAPGYLRIRLT